nr:hypothetical protein Q903MT_gene4759 [Picea sitchensis]
MDYLSCLCHDGHTHGKCLSPCSVGNLDNMMTFFMMHTWRVGGLLGGALVGIL